MAGIGITADVTFGCHQAKDIRPGHTKRLVGSNREYGHRQLAFGGNRLVIDSVLREGGELIERRPPSCPAARTAYPTMFPMSWGTRSAFSERPMPRKSGTTHVRCRGAPRPEAPTVMTAGPWPPTRRPSRLDQKRCCSSILRRAARTPGNVRQWKRTQPWATRRSRERIAERSPENGRDRRRESPAYQSRVQHGP